MKGKMSQSQILAVAGGVLFFLLAAALGWFGWGSLGETQEQAQALAERKVRPDLAAILTRPGGAGAARKVSRKLETGLCSSLGSGARLVSRPESVERPTHPIL